MAGTKRFEVGKTYRGEYYHDGTLLFKADFLVTRRNDETDRITIQQVRNGQPVGKKFVKRILRWRLDDVLVELVDDIGVCRYRVYATMEVA